MDSAHEVHGRRRPLAQDLVRIGAAIDAAAGIQMLSPKLFAVGMGLSDFWPGADWRFAAGMGGGPDVRMDGALLLWADRAPVERRDVLLLTVFPVVVGLAVNEAAGVATGFLSAAFTAPIWALQLALSALFLESWRRGRAAARAARDG